MSFKIKTQFLLLLIPVLIAVLAVKGAGFLFKAGVPLSCALILLMIKKESVKSVWFIISALVFSAAGDWFLSFKGDSFIRFALGIGLYFFAHLGYLLFALTNGKTNKWFTVVLLAAYLLFFGVVLYPLIDVPVLKVAVLLYLLVSCFSAGAAAGIQLNYWSNGFFFGAILLVLASDTIIAFHEFTPHQTLNFLILPTYYLAHILITVAILNVRQIKSSAI